MLLDCTLRDGAHVNNGFFGFDNINKIITSLILSKVNYIEVGFLEDCNFNVDRTFYPDIETWENNFFEHYKSLNKNQNFCIMARPDRFNVEKLKASKYIKTIRYAFYPKDIELLKLHVNKAKSLGFEVFINPINITAYSVFEIENCLKAVKDLDISGISIVDTFGALSLEKFKEIYDLFNYILPEDMTIGLHLHENLNASLGLIQYFEMFNERGFIYDGSLLGMGRIPGNIPIELLMTATSCKNGLYKPVELFKTIQDVIKPIKIKREWGYNPIYMMSAVYNIHRSYPEYFYDKHKLNYEIIGNILESMKDDSNRYDFSVKVADEYIEAI